MYRIYRYLKGDIMEKIIQEIELYLWTFGFIAAAILVGSIIHYVLFRIFHKVARRRNQTLDMSLLKHLRAPLRLLIPLVVLRISVPLHTLNLPDQAVSYLAIVMSTFVIIAVAWLLIRLTNVLEDIVLDRYRIDVADNLEARKMFTQMDIVRKIVIFVICLFAFAAVLMNFENFRQIGTSMLASAGVAGLIIGFAAQRTIANVLAGFQIALTQPIRIDDVVIVENEWGRIEEITLTYVVVAIWDQRRLVLPISYFIEQPFQNWTRISADILGTVFLYVDYTVPLQDIRKELTKILKQSEYWDGKVNVVQVTDARESTVEVRALVSAENSGRAWELRCEVREKLIDFIQKNYPGSLPKFRTEVKNGFTTATQQHGRLREGK
jgi:small-conductance mechanosensitive channel